jgi:hypothetical protein
MSSEARMGGTTVTVAVMPPYCLATEAETSATIGYSASKWGELDRQLVDWLDDPSAAVDPDGIAPSKTSIRIARRLVAAFLLYREAIPSAVVPDANGGIIFEWLLGRESRSIEISEAGYLEEVLIRNGRRVSRRPINIQ